MAGRKFRLFDLRRNFGSSEKIKISFFLKIFGKGKHAWDKGQKKFKEESGINEGSERKGLDKKLVVQYIFSKSADKTCTFKTKLV